MKNKVYLKCEQIYGDVYKAFDFNNLKMVRVFNESIEWDEWDDVQEMKECYPNHSENGVPITRQEFIDFFMMQTNYLNNITKEL